MQRILLWFLFLLPSGCAAAVSWKGTADGGFAVEITLSKKDLTLEEPLGTTITAAYPETHSLDIGKLRRNLLTHDVLSEPPFSLAAEDIQIPSDGNMRVWFSLEPQLLGTHAIALYAISFLPKNPDEDQLVEIISDIFSVTVSAPEIEEPGIAAPLLSLTEKNPIEIDADNRHQLFENVLQTEKEAMRNQRLFHRKSLPWGTFSAILLLCLIFLIARMRTKEKPEREKRERGAALSARAKALQSLKVLQTDDWIRKKRFDEYYSLLTQTVRNYLEERFGLHASTQTTQEFLEEAANNPPFDQETQQLLASFMVSCDAIKFAELTPSSKDCERAYREAAKIVNR
ncbi:MAG: hypothetical protein WB791_03760 [Waddliaceae bacterium]